MSRDEELRSMGLALEERATLRRRHLAIEAEIIRQGKAIENFASLARFLSQGTDPGWTLEELIGVPDGAKLKALIDEFREVGRELADAERRLSGLG